MTFFFIYEYKILGVVLFNHGRCDYQVTKGDRVAQLVIQPCAHFEIKVCKTVTFTERGAGGFGSTGK